MDHADAPVAHLRAILVKSMVLVPTRGAVVVDLADLPFDIWSGCLPGTDQSLLRYGWSRSRDAADASCSRRAPARVRRHAHTFDK